MSLFLFLVFHRCLDVSAAAVAAVAVAVAVVVVVAVVATSLLGKVSSLFRARRPGSSRWQAELSSENRPTEP